MTDQQYHLLCLTRDQLSDYLQSFPEHDQGDIRVWDAYQHLLKAIRSEDRWPYTPTFAS